MAAVDPPRPVFLAHPSSLEHDPGAHPEQPARIIAIECELERHGWHGYQRVLSPAVEREVLERVHPPAYVAALEAVSERGGGQLDYDTAMSAGSFRAALHAAGGAVALVEMLLSGRARTGFSAHRPPGHHAPGTQAMGFCLFNNVAVAAAHAIRGLGLERVLILDWDVHHGNGTNDIFHVSDQVLFVSIHQSPLYPGSGAATDEGAGPGLGFTVNLPVPPGSGDAQFGSLVAHVVAPLARRFRPQLMLISAGYDAHRDDPLADCAVTEAGYATMTATMRDLGAELEAPLGCVLEGGYSLDALAASVAATMATLGRRASPAPVSNPVSPLSEAALARLRRHWPGL
jgi:acetoin utilization deacetylase AcuC-like enzyme